MTTPTPAWVYIVAIAAAVGVMGLQMYLDAKRRRELAEEAARLGFAVIPASDGNELLSQGHALFSLGRNQSIDNLMRSAGQGARTWLFDYAYTTGRGKHRTRHEQTVAAFETPGALPRFQMFPERFYHWFEEVLGSKDIDFDDNKDFSDQYRLLGDDEANVRRLFNPPAVSRLATMPGWTVEGAGRLLLVYGPEKLVSPSKIADFLERARDVARAFAVR